MAANLPTSSKASHEELRNEKEGQSHDLTKAEQEILAKQLNLPRVKASYFMLYRYATNIDLFIIIISTFFAIVAGVIFPLMTVVFGSLTSSFQSFFSSHSNPASFRHEISHLSLFFVYLGITAFCANYIATVGFIYTGEHISQKLRQKYLAAILNQNVAFFDKLGAGEITSRITGDMATIQDGISHKLGLTVTGISMFFGALIVGFIKNWKLTFIMCTAILTMVVSMSGFSKLMVRFKQKSGESSGTSATIAEEVFSSIRNATALGTQERLAEEYDGYLSQAEIWGFRMRVVTGMMLGTMLGIIFCGYGLSFWEGSRLLVKGEMSVGQIITVLLATMMGSTALGQIAPHFQAFAAASATAGPIFSVIDRPPTDEHTDGKVLDQVRGEIELKGIKHVYPSRPEVVVMHDVDLTIPAGKVTALVGASGSGKSTIVGLVERFYTPIRSQVLLDGHDIQTLDLKWLRRQMALVSQEPVLFGTTIFANIAHGLIGSRFSDATGAEKMDLVVNAAKMANAHSFITSLPEGYDTNVGERGFLLSGGQKQRIAIARAVISDPRILLLDEATSALDTKSESIVQEALDAASQGRTTIAIAHRLSTIKGADNIVVMSEGSIVEQGTHEELVQSHGAYFQLLEAQKLAGDQASQPSSDAHPETSLDDTEHHELSLVHSKSHSLREKTISLTKTFTEKSGHRPQGEQIKSQANYSLWTLIAFVASFNKPEIGIMVLGIFCSILGGSAMPIQALFLGHEISALSLPSEQYPKLRHDVNFWSLMFLVLGLGVFGSYTGQGITFAYGSERLIFRARSRAIRSILRQDIAFFDLPENSSGALVSMLSTDVNDLSGMSGATLGAILNALTTIIVALALACAISWRLGLVCATAMPVLMCCGFLRFWMLARFSKQSRSAYQVSASYACEATAAIRTIVSLTREDDVLETYEAMLIDQTAKDLKSTLNSTLLYAASQAGMLFASALGFWYGGTLISNHQLSIQDFFVAFAAVIFGAQSTGGVFSYAPDMGKSKQAAETLKSLFDRVPEIDTWSDAGTKLDSVEGSIEFRDVKFQYPTRTTQKVLRGVNLTFKPGQYVALVGPSGCGKSTIVSLIERFYDPTGGSIFLDGTDISTFNIRDYRSHIALVSQEPVLYSGTIRENIMLGTESEVGEEEVIRACKDANIYDFIISLPAGLDTIVGSKGVMLSGGQKQRVAIARALIRDPKILLLDEATSALDSTSEKVVQEALDRVSKGRTTISVAHRLSTIQNADIIYVIDQGQVVESGNHDSLLEARGRYSELVQLQRMKKT